METSIAWTLSSLPKQSPSLSLSPQAIKEHVESQSDLACQHHMTRAQMALTMLITFIHEDLYNWLFFHSQKMHTAQSGLNKIDLTETPTHIQHVQSIKYVQNLKRALCTDDQCSTTVAASQIHLLSHNCRCRTTTANCTHRICL